jgi:hypothetical protein
VIRPVLLAAVAALSLVSVPASAAVLVFSAALRGNNEVPPAASPGTGFTTVTIDNVANTMRVQTSFSGLVPLTAAGAPSGTTASHIHCCAPFGTNAQVATTTPSFVGFPLGVLSGSMDQTYDMTLASSYNAAFLNNATNGGNVTTARATLFNGIAAGQTYLNIHTLAFPGGELRGQLLAVVPEPASWALMLAGFGLAGAGLRVRRRSAAFA